MGSYVIYASIDGEEARAVETFKAADYKGSDKAAYMDARKSLTNKLSRIKEDSRCSNIQTCNICAFEYDREEDDGRKRHVRIYIGRTLAD